jgi:hypothetical protein
MKPSSLAFAFVVAAAAAFAAHGADIYVWTDESGKTHLADSVPPKYRKSALRIDSAQFELSPEQQREAAAARAALEKKASTAASAPPPSPAGTTPAATAGPLRAPAASAAPSPSECEALQREYRESLECFAPYVNANGSLKPGAFAACRSVVNPTLKCGSPKAY